MVRSSGQEQPTVPEVKPSLFQVGCWLPTIDRLLVESVLKLDIDVFDCLKGRCWCSIAILQPKMNAATWDRVTGELQKLTPDRQLYQAFPVAWLPSNCGDEK